MAGWRSEEERGDSYTSGHDKMISCVSQQSKKSFGCPKLQSSHKENGERKRMDEGMDERRKWRRWPFSLMYWLFLIPIIKLHLKSSSVVTPSLFFFFSSSSSFVSLFSASELSVFLLRFHPQLLLPLYNGNTRNPEKVENFHPPIRFPFSSLR